MSKRDDGERHSWHGMNQPKPRLPYYFHASKRLSAGIGLNVILIALMAGAIAGWWLAEPAKCASIGTFKIGWC